MKTYTAEELAEATRTDQEIIEEGDKALLRLTNSAESDST